MPNISTLDLCRQHLFIAEADIAAQFGETAPTARTRFLPFGRSYFVVDTFCIGCEKLPYRDSFSLSMSGTV